MREKAEEAKKVALGYDPSQPLTNSKDILVQRILELEKDLDKVIQKNGVELSLLSKKFIQRMNSELLVNAETKGDWKEWNPDKFTAITELHWHVSKLLKALADENFELIAEYSADCANICMMISDKFGE